MADETQDRQPKDAGIGGPSRREFVATVVGGLAAATVAPFAQGLPVVETAVQITTPDGVCDASFIHPASGSHAAVIIWPDAFGLRPVTRDIGKRIAAEGYSVLVPNPFYRVAKAPVFTDASTFSFSNPADRARLQPLMGSINAPGAAEKDAAAFVAFLDAQPQVDASR
jgi:carboxymethylenebutenolidase